LNAFKNFLVFVRRYEGNGLSLGFESSSSADTMHVVFGGNWHVEIDDKIHLFDVNSSSEKISSNEDSVLAFLELSVDTSAVILFISTVGEGGK
jgi:hypothetical protein